MTFMIRASITATLILTLTAAVSATAEPKPLCLASDNPSRLVTSFLDVAFSDNTTQVSFNKKPWGLGYPLYFFDKTTSEVEALAHRQAGEYFLHVMRNEFAWYIGAFPESHVIFRWSIIEKHKKNSLREYDEFEYMVEEFPHKFANLVEGRKSCEYWQESIELENGRHPIIKSIKLWDESTPDEDIWACGIKSLLSYSGYENTKNLTSESLLTRHKPAGSSVHHIRLSDFARFLLVAPLHPDLGLGDGMTKNAVRETLTNYLSEECR